MAGRQEYEKVYLAALILASIVLAFNLYYYSRPLFERMGLVSGAIDYLELGLHRAGVYRTRFRTKSVVALLMLMCTVVKSGKGKATPWKWIAVGGGAGAFLFFWPFRRPAAYFFATLVGAAALLWSFAMFSRRLSGFNEAVNDDNETFEQCNELIETPLSVNIPIKYQYRHRIHDGWINIVNPARGTIVMGLPGSGKSFSIYNKFIEDMIRKGYTMFVYDYKFPDLTRVVYNEVLNNRDKYRKMPQFYMINFTDPERSNRCNPINPDYITDVADASEIAEIIMLNVSKSAVEKEDFFSMSAKEYLGALIWFLKIYRGGVYCDFPHLIELMAQDYKKVFSIMKREPSLEAKIAPFIDAMDAGAQDQLQGQIASARIPLNRFVSPSLYWVLSGNDFNLDISNPDSPKILCVGNDPDRQSIYGTTLALFTSRMFKIINHKGNLPCGVLLDELPTIFIKGLDNLIATARSNQVSIVLGAQDKTQLIRDYTEKEANVIFNTVGNHIVGQVNGRTAEDYNKSFGREFRRQESQTRSMDSESVNISFHQEELLPVRVIEGLTSGYFFGKVADNNDTPIRKKFFCGEVQVDVEAWKQKMKKAEDIPVLTDFQKEREVEALRDGDVARSYIEAYLERAVRSEMDGGGATGSMSDWEIGMEVRRRQEALSQKECDDILASLVPMIEKKAIEDTIEKNFLKIKSDIRQLIAREYVDPKDPDAEYKETTMGGFKL